MTDGVAVRVLIVDDQAPFRAAAKLVVSLTPGFEIVGEAISGEEAITSAEALKPDLILMDVNMDGIDGLEATERILAAQTARAVIVLSTYEPHEMEPRALAAGATAYIPKGIFAPDKLIEAWSAVDAA